MGTIDIIIIALNVIFSIQGFNNRALFDKYSFQVGSILRDREYVRLISSAFLHVDYLHLGLNMYVFWSFSVALHQFFTPFQFILVYVGSLLAGNLLALFIQRNNEGYRAVGASGAVSGVVYASILLMPNSQLMLALLPFFSFPAWVFGILYILYTIFGIQKKSDNIGHEAHLGGAVGGLLITLAIYPKIATIAPLLVAGLLLPTVIFLYILVKHPQWLTRGAISRNTQNDRPGLRDTENWERGELNRILDKINRFGTESLSDEEKRFLERYRD